MTQHKIAKLIGGFIGATIGLIFRGIIFGTTVAYVIHYLNHHGVTQ